MAEVVAAVLERPDAHVGKVYELTGPRSEDMRAVAAEYSDALGRTITYVDVPFEQWRDRELRARGLPEHVFDHLLTMAQLHADNRYDRLTHDVEAITGRPATSIRDFVVNHPELFGSSSQPAAGPRGPGNDRIAFAPTAHTVGFLSSPWASSERVSLAFRPWIPPTGAGPIGSI